MKNFLLKLDEVKNRGFTLVETLVAIAVLILVISGAFTAAQTGISTANYAKNQIIAFYLAGEGVEQIRNMRDENGLNSRHWLTGIALDSADPCYFGKACKVDSITNTVSSCPGGENSCPNLRHDSTTGFYGYDNSWDDSGFRREIILSRINDDEISILVTVSWSKGVINRQFKIRENIFNWQ